MSLGQRWICTWKPKSYGGLAGGIAKYTWKDAKNNADGPLAVSARVSCHGQL